MIGIEARLIAGLALLAALWFGWHRLTDSYREQGRQECRTAALAEYRENSDELARIAARSRADSARLVADAGAARSAADRLRGAVAGSGLVIHPATAGGGAPASDTERLSAELLGRAQELARIADERGAAGSACERSYDALSR